MDLKGLHWSQLYMPAMELRNAVIDVNQTYYPEMLSKVSVVNTPAIVNIFWVIIKPWLNSRTRAKVHFVDSRKTPQYLAEHFEAEHLPDFLGGQCQCPGGCMPVPEWVHKH